MISRWTGVTFVEEAGLSVHEFQKSGLFPITFSKNSRLIRSFWIEAEPFSILFPTFSGESLFILGHAQSGEARLQFVEPGWGVGFFMILQTPTVEDEFPLK